MTTDVHRSTPGRRRRAIARAVAAALAITLLLAGCRASSDANAPGESAGDGSGRLTVLVASSLVDVVGDLATAWGEVPVDVVDAGSQVLAAQLRAGAPADVVLLVDGKLAAALSDEGVAGPPTVVARNSLVLITRPGSSIDDVRDLQDAALRVVLADEYVPLGAATRRALGSDAARVLAGVDSLEDAARSVLAKVTSGEADAAVVYATDAAAAGDAVRSVPWPAGAAQATEVSAQQVSDRASAASLLRFLTGSAAHVVWTGGGFTLP